VKSLLTNFGFLLFPGTEELDLIGPWEMATMWRDHAQGPPNCLIVAQSLDPVRCAKGLSINPQIEFAQCPQLDLLLVPGGEGTRNEVDNSNLIEFIATQAKSCKAVLSVCTGSFLLQRAGLLAGKRATTHWRSLDRLRAFENLTVVEKRFVEDGKIWSSAGVSAGIDLMLAVIERFAGEEAAATVQLGAEYYPSPRIYGDRTRMPWLLNI
jgi:transcriptional regulator GlxA family with amidase domain